MSYDDPGRGGGGDIRGGVYNDRHGGDGGGHGGQYPRDGRDGDGGRGRSDGFGYHDSEGERPLYNINHNDNNSTTRSSNQANDQSHHDGESAAPQQQSPTGRPNPSSRGPSFPPLQEGPIPRRGHGGTCTPLAPCATTAAVAAAPGNNSRQSDQGIPRPGTFPPLTASNNNEDDDEDGTDTGMRTSMDCWGLETERNVVLHRILQLDRSQRFQAFRELLPEQQLILFFPDNVTLNTLPPMDPPADWDQRVQKAIQTCKEDVRQFFRKRRRASHPDRHSYHSEDSDDSTSHSTSPAGFNAPDPWQEEVAFLEALEYCIPMTAAFHVLTIVAQEGEIKCCYCPCGKHMEKWRQFTSMQQYSTCDYSGGTDPASLWSHVLTKQEDCLGHRLVYLFLKTVFQYYDAEGIHQVALDDHPSPAYKQAEQSIIKELKLQIDALKHEVEEKHILEAQLKKAKEDQATLQQINKDLASEREAEKKIKEKLAKTQYDIFRKDVESTLERENVDNLGSKEPFLSIEIEHGFNSIRVFQEWYKAFLQKGYGAFDSSLDPKTFGFLFAPLTFSKRSEARIRQANLRSQISKTWEVSMQQDTNLLKQLGEATGLGIHVFQTYNKGGLPRYFFSRLWNQLGSLSIKIPAESNKYGVGGRNIYIALFESSQGGLLPITDERLTEIYLKKMDEYDRENAELQIRSYFRAIGRILAHCMLKSIVVATHVLPDLYKTVLLRGLDIENDEYPLGLLIDHAGALLDVDYSLNDEPPIMLLQRKLGLDSDVHDSVPLRKQIKEIFVDNRRLALEYLREGLTLGGIINWNTLFGLVPTPTVNKLVFGRQDISEDMVFSSDGRLRFIRFEQDCYNERRSLPYRELQKRFEPLFTEFLRQKMQDDPTFISNFVEFCTGSPFLPDIDLNPDFHVRLEYNWSEMARDFLPVVHTCDNCIMIPAPAYDADIEVFQEKLATVMRLLQTSFDMQ